MFARFEAKRNERRAVRYKSCYIKPHRQGGYEISELNTIFGMLTFLTLRAAKRYIDGIHRERRLL